MKECLLDKSIQVTYTCTLLATWIEILSKILCYLNWPEKIAHISRVPREITSEKRAQKFYADNKSLL